MPFGPDNLAQILGSIGSLKGSPAGAAFAQRWAQLEAQKQAQARQQQQMDLQTQQMQMQQEDRAANRANIAADNERAGRAQRLQFIQSLPGFLGDESIETPEAFDQRFTMASAMGRDLGVEPGFLQTFRPTPDKFSQRKASKVVKRIEGDKRYASLVSDPNFQGQIFEDEKGERRTYAEWKALAGQSGPAAGSPALPVKADTPNTPEEQFYATYASERGTTWDKLPTVEKARARKTWMQADDRPQPQATVLIQTVDENGRPVQRFVNKTSGAEFTVQPTATQQTAMAEQQAGLDAIANIEAKLKDQYVGPIAGRQAKVQMAVPGAPDVPSEVAEFHAAVAGLENEIIKLMSGAAVSGAEERRMRNQLPRVTDKPSVFRAKLAQTKRNREALVARTQQSTGQKVTTGSGPKEGDTKAIPGIRGGEATYRNGKWIRTK